MPYICIVFFMVLDLRLTMEIGCRDDNLFLFMDFPKISIYYITINIDIDSLEIDELSDILRAWSEKEEAECRDRQDTDKEQIPKSLQPFREMVASFLEKHSGENSYHAAL